MESPPFPARSSRATEASGSAWLTILLLWGCVALYFNPPLLVLTMAAPAFWQAIAAILWVACLNAFWLYAIYYVVMGFLSRVIVEPPAAVHVVGASPSGSEPHGSPAVTGPRVVLLYATCNDFREEGVDSLLKVDWPNCLVIICDDSTLPEFITRIDAFARAASSRSSRPLHVIRRTTRQGWKAGNVNHALRELPEEFDYFAICDCDGVFPSGFVRDCLACFGESKPVQFEGASELEGSPSRPPRIAFVQARQEANPAQVEPFGRAMAPAVGAHFRHYVAARHRYGFVMFYGHGALISMAAWRAVGGFPEIVTEDLALSLKLRARGWRGVYAHHVVCLEDFPPTYAHLRKRTEKWIRGTAECLKLHFGEFWRAKAVPWWEKLDVLVHGSTHFMALPMFVFLLLLATVLPASIKEFRVPGGFFLPAVPDGKSLVERAMGLRYHVFWSWDFYVMMMLTMAGTWLPLLADRRTESRANLVAKLSYLATSTFVYLAGLLAETAALVAFAVTGRAYFRATYDAASARALTISATKAHAQSVAPRSRSWITAYHPNHPVLFALEFALGASFAVAMVQWRNLWFAGPAIALLLSPLARGVGFQNPVLRAFAALPLLIMLFLFALIGWQLLQTR